MPAPVFCLLGIEKNKNKTKHKKNVCVMTRLRPFGCPTEESGKPEFPLQHFGTMKRSRNKSIRSACFVNLVRVQARSERIYGVRKSGK